MVLEGDLDLARPADDRADGTPIPNQGISQCGPDVSLVDPACAL
jgi:hypothetical protein